MLILKITKGPKQVGEEFKIENDREMIVGRSSKSDIQLRSNGVSKKHCSLKVLPGSRLEVKDLGSSNGCFVNGLLIKKHVIKPGDNLTIHGFVMQVKVKAPELMATGDFGNEISIEPSIPRSEFQANSSIEQEAAEPPKLEESWLEKNIFPWADKFSQNFDVRFLIAAFFLVWSAMIILLSISPFSGISNRKIQEESLNTARLYARQIARINQSFILEKQYQKLIVKLDDFPGQTPGLVNAMIIDVNNGQILAPTSSIGRSISNTKTVEGLEILRKVASPRGIAVIDSQNIGHVSAPIRVGVPIIKDGVSEVQSKVEAAAYVQFDTSKSLFTTAQLLDSALNSLLAALVLSALFFLLVYRWTEGSLIRLSNQVEDAINHRGDELESLTIWPTLTQIKEQFSTLLSRVESNPNTTKRSFSDADWATSIAQGFPFAACCFDEKLSVQNWNPQMEDLLGIRSHLIINENILDNSRDVAFESLVKELIELTQLDPWTPHQRDFEISADPFIAAMVFGQGYFLLTITPREAD